MRAVLAICLIVFAAGASPAVAHDSEPGSAIPIRLRLAPPPTDADLARAEAANKPGPHTDVDDIADGLGVTDGREDVFRVRPDESAPSDAGWDGFIDGNGARIRFRW